MHVRCFTAIRLVAVKPDVGGMVAELVRLEREERELSVLRQKLHERLSSFPNAQTEEREREVSKRRRELHRRIDELRKELRELAPGTGA